MECVSDVCNFIALWIMICNREGIDYEEIRIYFNLFISVGGIPGFNVFRHQVTC